MTAIAVFVATAIWMFVEPGTLVFAMVVAVGVGAAIARWWVVGLALLLVPIALPFNRPDPDGAPLIDYVIGFGVPVAAALLAIGWLGGLALRRWG